VAIEKGQGKPISEISGPVSFRDYLKTYMRMFYRLGCPDDSVMHWLGVFFARDEDIKNGSSDKSVGKW